MPTEAVARGDRAQARARAPSNPPERSPDPPKHVRDRLRHPLSAPRRPDAATVQRRGDLPKRLRPGGLGLANGGRNAVGEGVGAGRAPNPTGAASGPEGLSPFPSRRLGPCHDFSGALGRLSGRCSTRRVTPRHALQSWRLSRGCIRMRLQLLTRKRQTSAWTRYGRSWPCPPAGRGICPEPSPWPVLGLGGGGDGAQWFAPFQIHGRCESRRSASERGGKWEAEGGGK